jgi:hypothetical protein
MGSPVLAEFDRQRIYREAFRAYLRAHAPRTLNGLPIINRELLDAATVAGREAVAATSAAASTPPTAGTADHGLVRG